MKDLIIYELHVRGFTRDESSGVRYKGTFAWVVEKIPYLKELGINCVELLPIFEFDELENPRFGNNNAYCQDNRISWLDWSRLKENGDVFELFSTLTAFRSAHPVLRRSDHFMGVNSTGYPELSFHGTEPWCLDRYSPFHTFGFMYTESEKDYDADGDTFIYCAINSYWEERTLRLPIIPEKMTWTILTYTGDILPPIPISP